MTERRCSTDECTNPVLWSGLCQRCYRRAEYQRNRQRYIKAAATWAANNPERRKAVANAHAKRKYAADPEAARARSSESARRRRALKGDEVRAKDRERYRRNAEDVKRRVARWVKENPERFRAIQRNRELRERNAPGDGVTFDQWQRVLATHDHRCFYCDRSDVKLQMEHMIPLSRGGWHAPFNVVPSCARCNQRKAALTAEEFVMRMVERG